MSPERMTQMVRSKEWEWRQLFFVYSLRLPFYLDQLVVFAVVGVLIEMLSCFADEADG